jgi:diaminopimelate epimerase
MGGAELGPDAAAFPPAGRRFFKYDALGNDYIVLDPADWPEPPTPDAIRRICDRHHGVGSDGILWGPISAGPTFQRSDVPTFALRLFNPDGSEFEKSGNGLRIFARYLWDRRLPASPDFDIDTPSGTVRAYVLDAQGTRIAMDMGRLSFLSTDIGVTGPARELTDEEVTSGGLNLRIVGATIGNPHCVVFLDAQTPEVQAKLGGLTAALAHRWGPGLEHLPLYPNRTNVQFAQMVNRHTLRIEIWERGAGYTLASGTSSCAAAGAAIRTGRYTSPVTVLMPGGEMRVEVAPDWSVRLTGTVVFVCSGEVMVRET